MQVACIKTLVILKILMAVTLNDIIYVMEYKHKFHPFSKLTDYLRH